ncbi:MAG TPA: GNAT family N-acetyltransferase [Acidimicrobiales bacterium]|nr:GNAT family N-acetyltransferase [Acidimicrobiales bacterium]
MSELVLREATEKDRPRLHEIFTEVVERGEGYPESPPLTADRFAASWIDPPVVVVGCLGDEVVGAYYLKPNFPGRAAHIANAGYVVAADRRGEGVGRRLVEDSIVRARAAGFDAVMFNLVFESNPARPLYERLGWREIGRVPRAVDEEAAVIYWRDV